MTLPAFAASRARELVSRFAGLDVLVIGDPMLDRFIVGDVTRISPEAPVPVVRFEREYTRLGGAANVAHNLSALGARVSLVGVLGRDTAAQVLRAQLSAAGIAVDGLVEDQSRPTVEKVRIVTGRNQQVARIDYERDADVTGAIERQVIDKIDRRSRAAKALLVSDYLKGTVTKAVMQRLLALKASGPPAIPLVVDPKIPHLDYYAGVTLVTPNQQEAESATCLRISDDASAREAAIDFRARARVEAVLITRGENGMWLSSRDAEGAIPAIAREVSDVTGAGDTVAATLVLGLAAGASLAEAASLANHAASLVVGKFGAATLSQQELLEQFTIHHSHVTK